MNQISLIGRLTKQPQIEYSNQGIGRLVFILAVRRDYKNRQTNQYETDFIRCVAWNQTAKLITDFVAKGQQIGLTGRLETRSFENQSGERIFVSEVMVRDVTLLGRGNANGANSITNQQPIQQEEQTSQLSNPTENMMNDMEVAMDFENPFDEQSREQQR